MNIAERHKGGGGPPGPPLRIYSANQSRQLAMRYTVRVCSSLTEAGHLVLLVRLEVALEPVPVVRMLLGPSREDVGGDAVEEPAVVGDNDGTAGECEQRIF